MSSIDERIVQMQFDNAQFERNVGTSLSTLDKLKKALNLEGAAKGLENVNTEANKMDFSAIQNGLVSARNKFSALEIAGITALVNITNKAVDAGIALTKSLSIDQVTAGWGKYEDKVTSVQTIMAATAQTWKEQADAAGFAGTQMEFVDSQLEKLNWFSDETSYSFTDMTNNIGKFTSNGIALQDSVQAMEGISTWAAKSGQNTQAASRAMYNLSQALSVGAVKLMDWRSIENANMATQEFKETALETAVSLGKLTKEGDGLYKTIDGDEVTFQNFSESLKSGWFNAEVLMATLKDYGSAAVRLSEISEEYDTTASKFLKGMEDYSEGNKDINQIAREVGISAEELVPLFDELGSKEYELGLSAFKAAQEAKTFTEAIDATKDAVSTGWMTTFELLFGNYEEAKVLWTDLANTLYDVFAASGEVRNEILGIWKEHGGRDNLIQSFKNLYAAINSVIDPIKEAFGEIFPSTISGSAAKLISLTYRFKEFTASLKLNEKNAENLKRTFRGVFAVVDILKNAFFAVASGAKRIAEAILPLGSGILGASAGFGDFLVNLRDTIVESDIFEKTINRVVDFILAIPDKIGGAFQKITGVSLGTAFAVISKKATEGIDSIKQAFKGFSGIDLSGIDEFTNKVKDRFHPLEAIFNGIKKVFDMFSKAIDKVAPIFKAAAKKIGKSLSDLGKSIGESLGKGDFSGALDLVNGGVLITIAVGLRNFIDTLTEIGEKALKLGKGGGLKGAFGEIKDNIVGVLNQTKDCLTAWQAEIKVKTLREIAISVGILTASLFVLSTIDSNKLGTALTGVAAEITGLVAAMKVLEGTDSSGLTKTAGAMVIMSAAILLLSSACKKLSDLSWDELFVGVAGVAGLAAIMTAVAKELSKSTGEIIKGTVGLIAFAIAIRLLVKPVKELGELNFEQLFKGLTGVLGLVGVLSIFLNNTDLDGMGIRKGLGILALAAAINVLATAVGKFSQMSFEELLKGVGAIGVLLVELGVFNKLSGDSKRILSTSIGMIALAAAMQIFGNALKTIAEIDINGLLQGLIAMSVALIGIIATMNLLPSDTMAKSVGLVATAFALKILAGALSTLGSMGLPDIGKGLLALGVGLAEITIALNLMSGTLAGSAALLVAAVALNMLVPVIKALGSMELNQVLMALIAMAGAFVVIGAAGLALAPVVPVLLGLGAAVMLLGAGALMCGIGVTSLAAGLTALAASGVVGINSLILVLQGIINLIPAILTAVAQGIVQMVKVIGESAGEIATTVAEVGTAILQALAKLIPNVLEFITILLAAIAERTPDFMQSVIDIIMAVLTAINDNAEQIVTKVIEVMTTIIETIASKAGDLVQAGIDLMLSLIEGLGQGIEDNAEAFRAALESFFEHMLNAVKNFLGIHSPSTKMAEIGMDMVLGLIKGVGDKATEFINKVKDTAGQALSAAKEKIGEWKTAGSNLISGVVEGVGSKIGEFKTKAGNVVSNAKAAITEKVSEWKTAGSNLMNNVVTGLGEKMSAAKSKAQEVINNAKSAISNKVSEWTTIGKNLAQGVINGIGSKIKAIADKAAELVRAGINAAKKAGEIQSPSKKMEEVGEYLDEGLEKGIEEGTDDVVDAATNMMDESIVQSMAYGQGAVESFVKRYGESMLALSDTSPTQAAKTAIEALAKATYEASKSAEDSAETAEKASKKAKSEIDKIKEAYLKLYEDTEKVMTGQMDIFKKFEYEDIDKMKPEKLLENMQSNVDAVQRYGKDLQDLAERGVSEPFLKKLSELGPKGVKTLEVFLKMSQEQLERANQLFAESISVPAAVANDIVGAYAYAGQMAAQGFADGIGNSEEVASNKVLDVATGTLTTLETALDEHSPSKKTFAMGEFFSQGFIEGIASKANDVIASVSDLGKRTVENLGIFNDKSQAIKLGEDICLGLAEGIKSKTQDVIRAAKDMADAVLEATTDVLEINSPSKAFERIGMYSDEGLARGLRDYSGRVGSAAEALGRDALDNVQSAIEFVKDMLNEGLDDGPTITPVLDLSNVASGAGAIDGLLNGTTLNAAGAVQIQNDRNNLVDAMKDAFSSIMMSDTPNGDITINVYGAQGQDPRAIAEAVEERLLIKFNRLRAARA